MTTSYAERADRIVELYLDGKTPAEISAELGCRIEYIHKIRKKRGIPAHHPRVVDKPGVRDDLARRYLAGHAVRTISQETGVPPSSIYRALRDAKISLRPAISTEDLDASAEMIVEKYQAGSSMQDIADELGCSSGGVRNLLLRNGVTLRTSARRTVQFDEDEKARIIDLRDGGASAEAIAKEFGRDYTVVSRFRREVGRAKRHRRPRVIGSAGYIYVRDADGELILEHRHVMGQAIGRPVRASETVHHINGDITDNRLENLQLRQGKHGKGVVMTCNACGSHDVQARELAT